MSRTPVAILRDNLTAHPAARAWSELQPARVRPESIHVLRERDTSGIYRLVGVGPAGTAVIAKRYQPSKASIELTVYQHILPHLPVTVPQCYGYRAGNGGSCWLFLEDVGGERYSESNGTHMEVVARWLALMHTSAARVAAAQRLPNAGPGRYLAHLHAARETIQRRLASPALLTPAEVTTLQAIASLLDLLEARWSRVQQSCAGAPATLVHGDFRPKNVYVRGHGADIVCYPVDWETAGWGVPAADLARIDIAAYWAARRERKSELDPTTVQRLANVGQVFRNLAAIDWESTSLVFDSRAALSKVMSSLAVLGARLADGVRTAGVTDW